MPRWRNLRNDRRKNPTTENSRRFEGRSYSAWEISMAGLEETLTDELTIRDPAGAGEQAPSRVGNELTHHVELCQLVENLDEAGAGITLVADKKQPGIVFHAASPGRPALSHETDPVVVSIWPAQDLRAVVAASGGETNVRT